MKTNEINTKKVEKAVAAALRAAEKAARTLIASRRNLTPAEKDTAELAVHCVANWGLTELVDIVGEAADKVAEID
jgi:hypothetical protein